MKRNVTKVAYRAMVVVIALVMNMFTSCVSTLYIEGDLQISTLIDFTRYEKQEFIFVPFTNSRVSGM